MDKKIYNTPELKKLDVDQTKSGPNTSNIEDDDYSPQDIDPS